jgi:mannose-6-phosphate isomerase-like protein (cupin superfamily)
MPPADRYEIHTDIRYAPLEAFDVGALGAACDKKWFNQSLCRVNDCVVRYGVFHGEFHWHKHDAEDEMFYVLEGRLLVDIEGKGTVTLGPTQAITVPKGVVHRTRAPERTVALMIEGAGVTPTGDP